MIFSNFSQKSRLNQLSEAWLVLWILFSTYCLFQDNSFNLSKAFASYHDGFGRNLFFITGSAAGATIGFSVLLAIVATIIGIIFGSFIVLGPSWLQSRFLMLLDFLLSFPSLLLALVLVAFLGPSILTLVFTISIGLIPSFTRMIYFRALEIENEDYVKASRGLGASNLYIFRHHLVPHLMDLSRIKFANLFTQALMAEATLTFMGVGAPAGTETWGSLLHHGRTHLIENPEIALFVGFPLFLTVFSIQILVSET
jgi:ABC-type dipeptide/oligopeptide/nickel transport system permease subunit